MRHKKEQLYDVGENSPIASIRFLTESQECNYIEYLAYLGLCEANAGIHKRGFNEDDIIRKLFIDIDGDGQLFLKNKYLYLYGEGASNYLFARQSMSAQKKCLDELETSVLDKTLSSCFKTHDWVSLIAVGSANAVKEINALRSLKNIRKEQKCRLVPFDVSAPLVQLATLYFHKIFKNDSDISIEPIIGDIFDAKEKKNDLFSSITGKKVFSLLGSTIGNYREKALLNSIIELMDEGDMLILGFDKLSDDETNFEDDYHEIYLQYNTPGNVQFQLSPLSYIPKYKGYIERFDRYFKLDYDKSIVTSRGEEEEFRYKQLSDVSGGICYAPILELPDRTEKITLAQSTKYRFKYFKDFISSLAFGDDNGNEQTFAIHSERTKKNAACLVLEKKVKKNLDSLKKSILGNAKKLLKPNDDPTDSNIAWVEKLHEVIDSLSENNLLAIEKELKLAKANKDLPSEVFNLLKHD